MSFAGPPYSLNGWSHTSSAVTTSGPNTLKFRYDWLVRDRQFLSFNDPRGGPLEVVIDAASIEEIPTDEVAFADDEAEEHTIIEILRRTLDGQLDGFLSFSRDRKAFYFTAMPPATRAWNLLNALFYKQAARPGACRAPRISTKRPSWASLLPDLTGQRLLTSTAQMFDERGRGLILRAGVLVYTKATAIRISTVWVPSKTPAPLCFWVRPGGMFLAGSTGPKFSRALNRLICEESFGRSGRISLSVVGH